MNDFYDALENCLQALEAGADLDSVLARYPHMADELRPILDASAVARTRGVTVPGPSAEAMRRGRTKVLQRAAQLREERTPAPRRVIPVFQRFSLAFSIAIIFLLSGTGLVRASSTALPGEGLYPVKRTLEDVRLFFVFNPDQRKALAGEYENERLNEIGELLSEGRHESIQFAGVVMDVNGAVYISGIRIAIVETSQIPAGGLQNGLAVIITGRTNAEGFVEAESIAVLPPGSVVPVGNPVVLEAENESSGSGSGSGAGQSAGGAGSGLSGTRPESEVEYFKIEGTVDSISNTTAVINGQTVYIDQAEIKGILVVGAQVEVEGYFARDGRFIVTEIEVERPEPQRTNENDNSNRDENGDDNSNDDSNENDDDSGDDDSNGSGSGGHDDDDDD